MSIKKPNPKDEEFDLDDKKDDNSQNRMIDIDSEEEKFGNGKSLYEIIYKLKHNTDLNELITRINQDLKNQFDKNKMKIVLNSFEFDKFEEKGQHPELKTTIYYSLEKKFKE